MHPRRGLPRVYDALRAAVSRLFLDLRRSARIWQRDWAARDGRDSTRLGTNERIDGSTSAGSEHSHQEEKQ